MEIVACKIDYTCAESKLHIFNITGQLISKIGVKSNLAATDPVKKMERGPRHVKQIACVLLSLHSSMILPLLKLMPSTDGLLKIKSDINDPHRSAE